MPTITPLGPFHEKKVPGMKRKVVPRHKPFEVTQEYLDTHRHLLQTRWWSVEGDAGVTVDEGQDGIPDQGWNKKDIQAWMREQGLEVSGYATKSKLLEAVAAFLNPEPVTESTPEPTVAEEPTGDE